MYQLSIKSDIAAAHFLRNYDGPCRDLHGHTWKIEVTIASEKLNDIGLVVDFRMIKQKLREFLDTIDHVCLNDLEYFKDVNPSTENIARYIYQGFSQYCKPFPIKQVRVWESESSSITYFE